MGFDKPEIIDDADSGGGKKLSKSSVSCSICLPVAENGDRSRAKLQCGHEFHLDCIGSAFNIKGAMQCPNCRKIEKGQWLFATGCCSFTDVSFEDWPHDEDFYDLGYPEMSFGVQWCPVTAFPRLPSFEEGEFPSSPYHDLLGQHALFPEHTAVTSTTHACPYLAYYEPIHSSSSITVGNVSNGSSFNTHWGGPSGPSEMPPSYSFATMDPHYQIWDHHSLPFSTTGIHLAVPDQPLFPSGSPRSSRINTSFPRSGSFIPPFIPNHSQYPGSAARARDRALALQAYFQPPMRTPVMANTRRSNGHGGLPPSSSDQAGGFYLFRTGRLSPNYPELENPVTSRFHSWERDHPANFPLSLFERDPNWGGFHPSTIGSGSFRHRHVLPQNRLRS